MGDAYRIQRVKIRGKFYRVLAADTPDWNPTFTNTYQPANRPDLLERFAEVQDEESLLRFAAEFGELESRNLDYEKWGVQYPQPKQLPSASRYKGPVWWGRDPVPWVLRQAATVRAFLSVLGIISDVRDGRVQVGGRIKEVQDAINHELRAAKYRIGGFGTEGKVDYFVSPTWHTDPVGAVLKYLGALVSRRISGIHFVISWQGKLELRFSALIEVVYWQLAQKIVGGEYRRCRLADCNRLFPVRDPREVYCTKSHASTDRKRRERQRKREEKLKRKTKRKEGVKMKYDEVVKVKYDKVTKPDFSKSLAKDLEIRKGKR